MDLLTNFSGFVILLLALSCSSIYAQEVCEKKGPCTCEFSNGTGIDLSLSANTTFYIAQIFQLKTNEYELDTFYYHPCFDVVPKVNATTVNNTCDGALSICRHVNILKPAPNTTGTFLIDNGRYDYLGSSNVSEFSTDGLSILYNNGPSSTRVMLTCAETDDALHVYSLEDPKTIVLSFYSRNACLRQIGSAGRSTGSTLLIIFFSFLIFYLVLGVCTKKFLMGATGIEVIPNLAFWSDLPNLVRDGWAFAINGFKLPVRGAGPVATPDPNSYDSI